MILDRDTHLGKINVWFLAESTAEMLHEYWFLEF